MNRLIVGLLFTSTVFIASFVLNATTVYGLEGEPAEQFVLNGLKSVHVTVSPMPKLNLSPSSIKNSVESKLVKSGMKLIGEKEFLNYTDVDQLLVKVIPFKHKKQVFYSLSISLTQMVFFENKADRRISVTSWQDQSVGLVDTKTEDQIEIKIMERLDKFINTWQRANGIETK